MSKIVLPSHTVSRRGVDTFALYCSTHLPQILWREETVNDFGVDGEIELTARNSAGKLEATGEILKIQIKATASHESYMKNETPTAFEFYAKAEDLEYWDRHKLDVLLVVYDDKSERLFAKKVNKNDYTLQANKKKSYPIYFDKQQSELVKGESNFLQKFSINPKTRLSFDYQERLSTNIFAIADVPNELFTFESKVASSKIIYDSLERGEYPVFVLYGNKLFTFSNLNKYPNFKEGFVKENSKTTLYYHQIKSDVSIRNHFTELLNKYLREFFYSKYIYYNKDYSRFYFGKPEYAESKSVSYKTRKKGRRGARTVVSFHSYGADKFYKHFAFEIDFIYKGRIMTVLNPKYIFTTDGRETLAPKKLTKYTNYLTKQEYNGQVLDFIHFYYDYFADGEATIRVANNDGVVFTLSKYLHLPAPFSIPTDSKVIETKPENPDNQIQQPTLL